MADAQSQSQPQDQAPGFKVFAGNLAYATTDEGLRAFFEAVATDIISAQVIQRGSRSAGYGFVAFSTLDAAEKAVAALEKKELDGRTIIVEIAKPADQKDKERSERRARKRVGRRGGKAPPGEVTEAEANGEATQQSEGAPSGDADAAPKKQKKKRNLRKKAKKAKPAAEEGEAAPTDGATSAVNGEAPKKKATRQPRKRTSRPAGEPPVGEPSQTVLFVANLGFNIDDAQLAELFTSNGINVASARIVRRRWGTPRRSKGYGFVDVGSPEEQQKALAALQGKQVEGREIAVKVAVNAQEKEEAAAEGLEDPAASEPAAVASA